MGFRTLIAFLALLGASCQHEDHLSLLQRSSESSELPSEEVAREEAEVSKPKLVPAGGKPVFAKVRKPNVTSKVAATRERKQDAAPARKQKAEVSKPKPAPAGGKPDFANVRKPNVTRNVVATRERRQKGNASKPKLAAPAGGKPEVTMEVEANRVRKEEGDAARKEEAPPSKPSEHPEQEEDRDSDSEDEDEAMVEASKPRWMVRNERKKAEKEKKLEEERREKAKAERAALKRARLERIKEIIRSEEKESLAHQKSEPVGTKYLAGFRRANETSNAPRTLDSMPKVVMDTAAEAWDQKEQAKERGFAEYQRKRKQQLQQRQALDAEYARKKREAATKQPL